MKIITFLMLALFCVNAFATVDVQGQATIVVENYHAEGEGRDAFFLQVVPTDFCVGIGSLALATAITQPVSIKANYGCGHSGNMIVDAQVNAATCAVVTATETTNADGSYNGTIVNVSLDVSGCGEKANNKYFVNTLIDAIYATYNQNGYQVTGLPAKSW